MTVSTIEGKSLSEELASNYRNSLPKHGKGNRWTMETFSTWVSLRYPHIKVEAGQVWITDSKPHYYWFVCEDHGRYQARYDQVLCQDKKRSPSSCCKQCAAEHTTSTATGKQKQNLNEEMIELIKSRYAELGSQREVARELGLATSTVGYHLSDKSKAQAKAFRKEWYANNKDRVKQTHNNYLQTTHGAAVAERQAIRRHIAKQNIDPVVYIDGIAHDVDLKQTWAVFCKALITEQEARAIATLQRQKRNLTKRTGIEHHLDHIHPLSKGGEHSPFNLKIVTKEENLSKGDTFRLEDQAELCRRLFNIN